MLSLLWARSGTRIALLLSAAALVVAMAIPAQAVSLTQTWAQRYVGGTDFQYAFDLAVSPDGGTVYVTGISAGPNHEGDPYDVFATLAYDATTGEQLWLDRFAYASGDNWASSIVVSPDGQRVFVTGLTPDGYPVIGLDAATGAQLWVKGVPPETGVGSLGELAVSPDSRLVYFTGETLVGDGPETQMRTMAFRTTTGAIAWSKAYQGSTGTDVQPWAITVDRQGRRVFVTGATGDMDQYPSPTPPDYVTVAYGARLGTELWARTYDGPAHATDVANAVSVTPDGQRVIVAGSSTRANGNPLWAMIAYNAVDGEKVWLTRDGAKTQWRSVAGMTMNASGSTVYVTGTQSVPLAAGDRYRTASFSVNTGARGWSRSFADAGIASATGIAISPDSAYVYVTGQADNGSIYTYATIAYTASGQRVATAWYLDTTSYGLPESIGVSPSGDIFVTGRGGGAFATVAYDLG